MLALRRAGFNPPWPTEVGPTTRHACRLWALFHVKDALLMPCQLFESKPKSNDRSRSTSLNLQIPARRIASQQERQAGKNIGK